jgi:hypothetical protein
VRFHIARFHIATTLSMVRRKKEQKCGAKQFLAANKQRDGLLNIAHFCRLAQS